MAKSKKETKLERIPLSFSAVDREWVTNIIQPTESEISGRNYVQYGDMNQYPQYLHDLMENALTLKSIINGTTDYVLGDGVSSDYFDGVNAQGHTIRDVVKYCCKDYLTYGGFAMQVTRNKFDVITSVMYIDFKKLRSDKHNTIFYFSDDWKRWTSKSLKYPKFKTDGDEATSIYYYKDSVNSTYPTPVWGGGGVIAAELEKSINEYHLNNIHNGFSASYIINLNNGTPTDEVQAEIEELFDEKFTGTQNAGRFILNFATDKEHGADIQKLEVSDFDKQYEALAKRSREQLFTAFRATPNLFGINTESLGFSSEEYKQAYKLYNKTVVQPIQTIFIETINKITGRDDALTIQPFTINFD